MKLLVTEKCKSSKLYRRMCDVYKKKTHFSQKIFTNGLNCLKKV